MRRRAVFAQLARRSLVPLVIGAATLAALAGGKPDARADSIARPAATALSITGESFRINGELTYEGRSAVELRMGGTADLEGLLLNARMVNAVFDDANDVTRSNWTYPSDPAQAWDAERNTSEFVRMLPQYRASGLLMVTVGLQGGNPAAADAAGNGARPSWAVSAFDVYGALDDAWMERLATVIEAADAVGMVVNVSLFYQRQEHVLAGERAAETAVDSVADWVVGRGYQNVLLTVQNEVGSSLWDPGIWTPVRAHELIARIQARHPELIVGTGMRAILPSADIIAASDFVAFSANTMTAEETGAYIDAVRALPAWKADPKPILVIEDGPRPSTAEMETAIARGVSFGYHDDGPADAQFSNYRDGFQWVPASWRLDTDAKLAFFEDVARLTGASALPGAVEAELLASSTADRSDPRPLDGQTIAGDAYIFVRAPEGVTAVRFWIDDPRMSGPSVQDEQYPPWDLAGGTAAKAEPFNADALTAGDHTVTAELATDAGAVAVLHAAFTVGDPLCVHASRLAR